MPRYIAAQGAWRKFTYLTIFRYWPLQMAEELPQNEPTIAQQGLLDGGRAFMDPFAIPGVPLIGGTFGDRPIHYMYPYLMPLANGDVALFLVRHSALGNPALMWAAHRVGDAPGEMGARLWPMQSASAAVKFNAFSGEYEGIALDPTNENRAWGTGQLGRCCVDPPCSGVPECNECSFGVALQSFCKLGPGVTPFLISRRLP
jgi:hypothetical protein